jgi:protease IV
MESSAGGGVDGGGGEGHSRRRAPVDRRSLLGILLLVGLILLCFGFALLVLYSGDEGPDEKGPHIGVVQVRGVIMSSRRTVEELRRFRKDKTIKAVVLRVESPGGSVGPSQDIYREVERTRKVKPVVASMGAVAASGGYYVSAACDRIVAAPGTLTGSIGVITQSTQVSELLALAKIKTTTFKTGPFKDTGSPLREMREDEKGYMQALVTEIYRQFVRDVARARKLPEAKVREVADGRVFSGEQALGYKLVDEIGNLSDALDAAARLAKVSGEPVGVYAEPRRGLISQLLQDSVDSLAAQVRDLLVDSTRVEAREPGLN